MTGWKKGEAILVVVLNIRTLTFVGSMIAASNIHFDTISGRSHRFPFKSETKVCTHLLYVKLLVKLKKLDSTCSSLYNEVILERHVLLEKLHGTENEHEFFMLVTDPSSRYVAVLIGCNPDLHFILY